MRLGRDPPEKEDDEEDEEEEKQDNTTPKGAAAGMDGRQEGHGTPMGGLARVRG